MYSRLLYISYKWGLTKDGVYSSKSGYRFFETLQNIVQPQRGLPPIEKKLWSSIWKIKAPSKLKHFLWKVLAGALAVKDRLRSRGIQLDTTCAVCSSASESICHLLFNCPLAQEVWERSNIKIPRGGFSRSSVFLNVYHLLIVNGKNGNEVQSKSFIWIMWQIWKGRNELVFERRQTNPISILSKAIEDANIWFAVNTTEEVERVNHSCASGQVLKWSPPPIGYFKCNIGIAWERPNAYSGAAWILRDHNGKTIMHSRRSFSGVQSQMEAELLGFKFAVESMISTHQCGVILESHYQLVREAMLFPQRYVLVHGLVDSIHMMLTDLDGWQCVHVVEELNKPASEIAQSVINENRLSSYIARGGPHWLQLRLCAEATST